MLSRYGPACLLLLFCVSAGLAQEAPKQHPWIEENDAGRVHTAGPLRIPEPAGERTHTERFRAPVLPPGQSVILALAARVEAHDASDDYEHALGLTLNATPLTAESAKGKRRLINRRATLRFRPRQREIFAPYWARTAAGTAALLLFETPSRERLPEGALSDRDQAIRYLLDISDLVKLRAEDADPEEIEENVLLLTNALPATGPEATGQAVVVEHLSIHLVPTTAVEALRATTSARATASDGLFTGKATVDGETIEAAVTFRDRRITRIEIVASTHPDRAEKAAGLIPKILESQATDAIPAEDVTASGKALLLAVEKARAASLAAGPEQRKEPE